MDQKKLQEHIAQVSNLSDEDLSLLLTCVTSQTLKRGEKVLEEGEVCHSFYLVDKGHLRTCYNKDGVRINLNFTFEGDFASNLKSLASKDPSELIIEAGEETSVWIFNLYLISADVKQNVHIARFVRQLAIRLLLATEEHSTLFRISTPTERYRHIEKNNPQLLQRISLSQMASYLGVTRETLSRIRGQNG